MGMVRVVNRVHCYSTGSGKINGPSLKSKSLLHRLMCGVLRWLAKSDGVPVSQYFCFLDIKVLFVLSLDEGSISNSVRGGVLRSYFYCCLVWYCGLYFYSLFF